MVHGTLIISQAASKGRCSSQRKALVSEELKGLSKGIEMLFRPIREIQKATESPKTILFVPGFVKQKEDGPQRSS